MCQKRIDNIEFISSDLRDDEVIMFYNQEGMKRHPTYLNLCFPA